MDVYLVGGAVRDRLLGLPSKDSDYVVVNGTITDMVDFGYKQVGADFPVFLHPETGEVYALARTEYKRGNGYTGFETSIANVTLEEDLYRRDLTINAMAIDSDGRLIDPYGGQRDITARVLRHASPSFKDDPVRVLRVARFMARYSWLGFTVAEETQEMMRDMVGWGDLVYLTPERVWKELEGALMEPNPSEFIRTLRDVGALAVVFPEIDALFGVPQNPIHHPEIDCGIHTLMSLDRAVALGGSLKVRVAALLHDLGKAITPKDILPKHIDHENTGEPLVWAFCERFRIPSEIKVFATKVCKNHLRCHRVLEMRSKKILELIETIDGIRRPQQAIDFALACKADAQGRLGKTEVEYIPYDFITTLLPKLREVNSANAVAKGLVGEAIGVYMRRERMQVIAKHKKEYT